MCTVSRTFPDVGTLVCNNAGANTHAGLHTATATARGRNATWQWSAPASGTQTATNACASPSLPRVMQVGVPDL